MIWFTTTRADSLMDRLSQNSIDQVREAPERQRAEDRSRWAKLGTSSAPRGKPCWAIFFFFAVSLCLHGKPVWITDLWVWSLIIQLNTEQSCVAMKQNFTHFVWQHYNSNLPGNHKCLTGQHRALLDDVTLQCTKRWVRSSLLTWFFRDFYPRFTFLQWREFDHTQKLLSLSSIPHDDWH